MTSPEHRLRILVLDSPGIGPVADGLGRAIARHTQGRGSAEVTVVPSPPAAELAAHLGARDDLEAIDVVVTGVGAALASGATPNGSSDLRRTFREAMVRAMAVVKEHAARMLLVNGSTVVAGLDRSEARRRSLDIARLNLAALDLSVATGLSIIDADRTIAEIGGDECVRGVLVYDDVACDAIRGELVRVLEDYGFFDERPLLEQVGRGGTVVILRLDTPVVPRTIVTMRVVRWHAAAGDEVAFGDILVELQTEQGMKRLLEVDGRRVAQSASGAEVDHSGDLVIPKPPQHHIELVASDTGVIRQVLAPEGHVVRQGDVLAVLSSTVDEPVAEPVADAVAAALPFRAVADIVRIGVDLAEDY